MMQQEQFEHAVSKIMADKRDTERVSAVFSGIVMNQGVFVCHCVIRDVSQTGMRLEFDRKDNMLDDFEIKTPALPDSLKVRSMWKKNKAMGVEFVFEDQQEEVQGAA